MRSGNAVYKFSRSRSGAVAKWATGGKIQMRKNREIDKTEIAHLVYQPHT